jgi:hypothetical protein
VYKDKNMTMTPAIRKLALVAHITFSVGWLGAVVPYLALTITGLTTHDAQMARAAYLSMELIGWFVIVPFSLAALLTGLIQSLGTPWGLFRHWWILGKLLLTTFAVVVLLQHMQHVSRVARIAKETDLSSASFLPELVHAGGGLLVLLTITMLSVFKPLGLTPYGQRRVSQAGLLSRPNYEATLVPEPVFAAGTSRWKRVVGIHAIHAVGIALLLVVILHLTGGGLHGH